MSLFLFAYLCFTVDVSVSVSLFLSLSPSLPLSVANSLFRSHCAAYRRNRDCNICANCNCWAHAPKPNAQNQWVSWRLDAMRVFQPDFTLHFASFPLIRLKHNFNWMQIDIQNIGSSICGKFIIKFNCILSNSEPSTAAFTVEIRLFFYSHVFWSGKNIVNQILPFSLSVLAIENQF